MRKIKTLILFLFLSILGLAKTDKYRLILTSDPSSTITIAWNQVSGENPTVKYGIVDYGKDANSYPLSKTVDRTENFRGMKNQFARIKNLKPNTYYYFVIKDSEGVSKRFYFKTAPNDKSRMSFIAGGDSRNNRVPRKNANKLVAKLKPNAVLFGGDMTASDNDAQWKDWFDDWQLTTASDGRMFPIVPTRGNHEQSSTIYKLFDTTHKDSYGAITFGDDFLRVYTLNTEISVFGDQRKWLKEDLEAHATTLYKTAQYHRPMRPHTKGKAEGIDRYNAWAELFYDNAVKLVVDCDSHTVKTTFPVKPSKGTNSQEGFEIDNDRGTTYVGEGCWGAPLRKNDDDKNWTRSSGSFNQFKWFFVDKEKIELRTIKIDNADQVGEVTNEDPFTPPSKLNVWKMRDGKTVAYVYPTKGLSNPEVEFSPSVVSNFPNKNNIEISINVLDEGSGIRQVEYKAISTATGDETILGTVTSAPFSLNTNFPKEGQYKLVATIISTENISREISKIINVGSFETSSTIMISKDSNDMEEGEGNNGTVYLDSSDLELGYDSYKNQNYQKVGLRFENLGIPQGAKITSVKIIFTAKDSNSDNAQSTIKIEDNVNSSEFSTSAHNLSNRTFRENTVVWDISAWSQGDHGENTTTPELKELLQALVDNPNWQTNSAVTFMFTPSGPSTTGKRNKRNAQSFNGSSQAAPQLLLSFQVGDGATVTTEAQIKPGVGINTDNPATPLDVNGLFRSSVRDSNGNLYPCSREIEGAIGYDNVEKNLKICIEVNGVLEWRVINLNQ